MVSIVAAGETGSLLEAETASPYYILYWYNIYLSLITSADCDTGAPGIGKKTQCTLLCRKLEFQYISLDDILREMSDDPTYPHAEFVKSCLEEKVDVPRELSISLLERKINEGIEEGKTWSLVHGFPNCIQELLEFEEKVSLPPHKEGPTYIW